MSWRKRCCIGGHKYWGHGHWDGRMCAVHYRNGFFPPPSPEELEQIISVSERNPYSVMYTDCSCGAAYCPGHAADATPVPGHIVTRRLEESIWYPDHDPRKASPEYKRVHHHLVYELDEACWVCGVRQSTLPRGEHMETHHWHVEWALANRIDPAKIIADFPEMGAADDEHLRSWLDSEGNMLVLCSVHHRHGLYGIHEITYPAWVAQRWLKSGTIDRAA